MNDENAKKLTLINAIYKNDTTTVSSLISSCSVNLNGEPWPLHRAAQLGRVEIMSMLLDAGADINAVDRLQQSACRKAIWDNHFDAFKLLVERGADLGAVDSVGHSLLSTIAQKFNRLLARGVNFIGMRDVDGATLCHHVTRNVTCEDDLRVLVNLCGNDAIHRNGHLWQDTASLGIIKRQ
jgi:hypothetical protein